MANFGKSIAKAGAVVMVVGLWALPANAFVTAAMCKLANKHLTDGHCCPAGQDWGAINGVPQCVQFALGIEDPRDTPNPFAIARCKALHTC